MGASNQKPNTPRTTQQRRWQRYVPLVAGTVIVAIVAVLLVMFVRNMLASKKEDSTRMVAQEVKIIRPPPPPETPPPPPPPPEEKIEQPVEQPPEQAPEQAAPAESLGLDADASAGGDGFGLAARPGGRDLVGTGTAPFRWYTDLIQSHFQQCLSADERVRKGSYRVNVRLLLKPDGQFEIADLIGSSGSKDRDDAIRSLKNCSTGQDKPVEMPRMVSMQIVSRG